MPLEGYAKRLGSDYAQEYKAAKAMCWSIKKANSTLGNDK